MSSKSHPGDGSHSKGVKGVLFGSALQGPVAFAVSLVRTVRVRAGK
ncbi:hypothetical protein [Wenjunlia tyrosinilytica]|uniref:Uncharacterized protein n=1 Tax=Wenjunlia tyrosinilytica TaxID=1544741 RepID=A0A917ZY63_9ACTN|nr:hypothetical protein [Wenjunlia tyrosinilytica]GGO98183.1 hypothetical protein GCM10012280_61720 [Wenjunlia tyrosinilytica]